MFKCCIRCCVNYTDSLYCVLFYTVTRKNKEAGSENERGKGMGKGRGRGVRLDKKAAKEKAKKFDPLENKGLKDKSGRLKASLVSIVH